MEGETNSRKGGNDLSVLNRNMIWTYGGTSENRTRWDQLFLSIIERFSSFRRFKMHSI